MTFRNFAHRIRSIAYRPLFQLVFAGNQFYCPVCDTSVRFFLSHGNPRRQNALCPVCGSLERHRFTWFYIKNHTNLYEPKPKRILHFAPEWGFLENIRKLPHIEYIAADITKRPGVAVQVDITKIQFADCSFDFLICSHVLEHVVDDRTALREIYRVLKPGGSALIMVPVSGRTTLEDASIQSPSEREQAYGHPDHVRYYGLDFQDRLADANFRVKLIDPKDFISEGNLERAAILPTDFLFHCVKAEISE